MLDIIRFSGHKSLESFQNYASKLPLEDEAFHRFLSGSVESRIMREDLQSEEPSSNATDHDQIVPTNTRDMFKIFNSRENGQGFNRVLQNCNVAFNVNTFYQ